MAATNNRPISSFFIIFSLNIKNFMIHRHYLSTAPLPRLPIHASHPSASALSVFAFSVFALSSFQYSSFHLLSLPASTFSVSQFPLYPLPLSTRNSPTAAADTEILPRGARGTVIQLLRQANSRSSQSIFLCSGISGTEDKTGQTMPSAWRQTRELISDRIRPRPRKNALRPTQAGKEPQNLHTLSSSRPVDLSIL